MIEMIDKEFYNNKNKIVIPSFFDETWVPLNTQLYPNILPVYWISSKARIYNESTNRFIKKRCLDPLKSEAPYYKANLQVRINNKNYSDVFLVHRLMMASFYPIDNMEVMLVNHKDGNKLNDELENLEWVTNSENIIHAYKTGLFKPIYGEKHCCATLTERDVQDIVKLLLSRKYTHKEIANKIGTTVSIVDSIAARGSWKHITESVDMSSLKQRLPKRFSFDDIEGCCEYFERHPKESFISIRRHCLNALNYINYNNIDESSLNSIRKLYLKERYTSISSKYNF